MSAVTREELVAELLPQGDLAREHVGREQPLDDVVVAPVAVAAREAEHTRDRVGLEHRADGVRRDAEPVGRCATLALEVERRQRTVGADPLEDALGHVGVVGERAGGVPVRPDAEPRQLAHGDEREPLVERLEDLATLVELVAPGGVVVGHARVQHEVVGAIRQPRSGRTGSSRVDGRPRAPRRVLPRANAPARAHGAPRESAVRPRQ